MRPPGRHPGIGLSVPSPVYSPVHRGDDQDAFGERERGLDRFGQAQLQVVAHPEAVDHDLDPVLALRVQGRRRMQLAEGAIDTRPHEALRIEQTWMDEKAIAF
jgi:hypothetical protein